MSMSGNTPPPPDGTGQSQDPYAIPDTYTLPGRTVITEGNVGRKFPNNPEYIARPVTTEFQYTGTRLVGISNKPERDQYQTADEAFPILAGMRDDSRVNLLKTLETYGFYGARSANSPSQVVGSGLGVEDQNAFRRLLIESNGRGRTYQGTLAALRFEAPVKPTGPSVRYTPKQDVRENFKRVFLSDVGRRASEAEISKFEAAYRGMESAAGTTQSAPSISSAATESIGMNNKAEEQANGFLQVAQTFERLLRG